MKYILKHKKNEVYLKYIKSIDYKHYVADVMDATLFDKKNVNIMLKKFKNPNNWEILGIKENKKGDKL